jgi:hypothetical protein
METLTSATDLPPSSAWLFPEYIFDRMNTRDYANVIIERILDRGSWDQIRWLLESYGRPTIGEWVKLHGYRRLNKRAFHYWCWMLGITEYRKPPWEITNDH